MIDDDESASHEASLLLPGLVHEMRHPLMGIKAGLQLIGGLLGRKVESLEEWTLVMSQVKRMEELFRSYQELMDPDPRMRVDFAPAAVAQRAIDLLAFRIRPLGPRFGTRLPDELPLAHGSPSAALHAVINLVSNALEAIAAAPEGRVEVSCEATTEQQLVLRVSDNGCGIPAEIRSRLFEPRFTTKRAQGGTGLGLHIAQRMVSRSGGRIQLLAEGDARARPWARTEFWIVLPQQMPASA